MMRFFLPVMVVFLAMIADGAKAHFLTDAQSREIHLTKTDDGADLFLRLPLTFAYAAELAGRTSPDARIDAPFLSVEVIGGTPFYRFDFAAFVADQNGFAAHILRDFRILADGEEITPELETITINRLDRDAGRSQGLDRLRATLAAPGMSSEAYVSELAVVARMRLPKVKPHTPISIEITAAHFPLPPGFHISNIAFDHRATPAHAVFRDGFWPADISLLGQKQPTVINASGSGVLMLGLGVLAAMAVTFIAWQRAGRVAHSPPTKGV